MLRVTRLINIDRIMILSVVILVTLSVMILRSVAPSIFPSYFLFIIFGFIAYFLFLQIDFDVLTALSTHIYVFSVFLLLLPLIFGQITRGAIRWIPLGPISIQPSEIVRPFLLVFFSTYLTKKELDLKRLLCSFLLLFIPFFLILIQPSLGVAILTFIGFIGVLIATEVEKRNIIIALGIFVLFIPLLWSILAPYQRQRVFSFINPYSDPQGAGYNSIQSMVAVGSGKLFGRGLGEGVQTQLAFLPEKHTDFIFATVAEELGLVGSLLIIVFIFIIFYRLINIIENPKDLTTRAFTTGFLITLFAEAMIHIGMNLGLLPITGVPLPLVSAGGSSFLATMIGLAMAVNATRVSKT